MTVAINGAEVSVIRGVADLVREGLVGPGTPVEVPTGPGGSHARGWLVVESDQTSVTDRRCAVIGAAGEVLAVGKLASVAVYLRAFDAEMPVWASGVAQVAWDRHRAEEALERAQGALRAERDLWSQRLETAHEWAIARNHCSEYDDIMDVLGLPGRERDFCLDLTVSMDVRVVVAGRDGDVAQENLSDRAIAEVISQMSLSELTAAINDHDVDDVGVA